MKSTTLPAEIATFHGKALDSGASGSVRVGFGILVEDLWLKDSGPDVEQLAVEHGGTINGSGCTSKCSGNMSMFPTHPFKPENH